MALTTDCINVFYQPNHFILLLRKSDESVLFKLNNKQFNLKRIL